MNDLNAQIEQELTLLPADVNDWYDENWIESWSDQATDRWQTQNQVTGWSLDQARQEFDSYFAENGASLVSDSGSLDNQFEVEL